MAQKVSVQLVDDLDGSTASGTVDFGIDGRSYAIDLSDENAAKLRDALAPFVDVARRPQGGRRAPQSAKRPSTDREYTAAVRAWANDNGHDVAERGRIPAVVLAAYEQRDEAPAKAASAKAPKAAKSGKKTSRVATDPFATAS